MWAPAVMQSAEELDKQRLEAQQKRDAQMKQERADRAKKNAEVLAQQKVCAGRVQPPPPPLPPLLGLLPTHVHHKPTHATLMARQDAADAFEARYCLQLLHYEQFLTTQMV